MAGAGVADELLVQVAYAIGVARPVSIYADSYGTAGTARDGHRITDGEIAEKIAGLFDLRPARIIEKFNLKKPIYEPTAAYGHVGRKPYQDVVEIVRHGKKSQEIVQFFGWELLDSVDRVKEAFDL